MDKEPTQEQLDAIALAHIGGLCEINYALTGDPQWLPDKSEIATAESWETNPMPKDRLCVEVDFHMDAEQFALLRRGHIPQVMEDKWFMYFDEDESEIRLYRSWTGNCIFQGKVEEFPGGERVITRVIINDDEEQYHGASIDESLALFCALVAREAGMPSEFYWNRWTEEQRERR